MKKASLDENEAFHRLQELAQAKNSTLVEIARGIITAAVG
jgi:AmiR/NasT family two-component response regulator